jgi:hypothetical protein
MEVGVSSIPVSEVRTENSPRQYSLTPFNSVLLRRTRCYRGELHSFRILQRSRHAEGGWRTPAETQKILSIEVRDKEHCSL